MAAGWQLRIIEKATSPKVQHTGFLAIFLGVWGGGDIAFPLEAQERTLSDSDPETVDTWPVLQVGDQGNSVQQLQIELSRIGLSEISIDGTYGPTTEAAVRQFQRDQGLTPDGIVGPQTWQALAFAQTPAIGFEAAILAEDGASRLTFTPLTFTQPPPPPSPLWLVLMPLIPVIGGALTYVQRRLRGREPISGEPSHASRHRSRAKKNPEH
jgi:hypothetical protein